MSLPGREAEAGGRTTGAGRALRDMMETTRAIRLAATRATAAGVVLKQEAASVADPNPVALEVAERQLRLAFLSIRRQLLVLRRRARRAS